MAGMETIQLNENVSAPSTSRTTAAVAASRVNRSSASTEFQNVSKVNLGIRASVMRTFWAHGSPSTK